MRSRGPFQHGICGSFVENCPHVQQLTGLTTRCHFCQAGDPTSFTYSPRCRSRSRRLRGMLLAVVSGGASSSGRTLALLVPWNALPFPKKHRDVRKCHVSSKGTLWCSACCLFPGHRLPLTPSRVPEAPLGAKM